MVYAVVKKRSAVLLSAVKRMYTRLRGHNSYCSRVPDTSNWELIPFNFDAEWRNESKDSPTFIEWARTNRRSAPFVVGVAERPSLTRKDSI